jgi:hypothetical protein
MVFAAAAADVTTEIIMTVSMSQEQCFTVFRGFRVCTVYQCPSRHPWVYWMLFVILCESKDVRRNHVDVISIL